MENISINEKFYISFLAVLQNERQKHFNFSPVDW